MSRRSHAPKPRRSGRRRAVRWIGVIVVVGGIAGAVAWTVLTTSPTPGALLIRAELDSQSQDAKAKMAAYADKVPGVRDVSLVRDQAYLAGDDQALLDVFSPVVATGETAKARPTIVWMHGGGWLAGDKADWAPYYELLAARGFTVVSVGYALAPEHHYPRPVVEGNAALAYLVANAKRLQVDPSRLILAGDSAGAQIASQVAAITTNPAFAKQLGIEPAIAPSALRGTILHCGVYDTAPLVDQDVAPGGPLGFTVATLMWAYANTKNWDSAVFPEMSTIDHVTKAFPPTFITGGNSDPLTDGQSRPFAAKLSGLGVKTEATFYPAAYRPKLAHEFQFDLAKAEARHVLDRTVAFARAQTTS